MKDREHVFALLSKMERYPKMYAITKEAYIAQIALVLWFIDVDTKDLYHFISKGNSAVRALEEVTETWSTEVFAEVNKRIEADDEKRTSDSTVAKHTSDVR